jgi:hypothetical protein
MNDAMKELERRYGKPDPTAPAAQSVFLQSLLAVILDHGYGVHLIPTEFGAIVMRLTHVRPDRLDQDWTQHAISGLELSEATVGPDRVLDDVLGFLDQELTANIRARLSGKVSE